MILVKIVENKRASIHRKYLAIVSVEPQEMAPDMLYAINTMVMEVIRDWVISSFPDTEAWKFDTLNGVRFRDASHATAFFMRWHRTRISEIISHQE